MDHREFGMAIARLRKQHGMTQVQLAEKLNVTSKAVSKWETGVGYPEITLLPKIAAVFDVSTDSLLAGSCQQNPNG